MSIKNETDEIIDAKKLIEDEIDVPNIGHYSASQLGLRPQLVRNTAPYPPIHPPTHRKLYNIAHHTSDKKRGQNQTSWRGESHT